MASKAGPTYISPFIGSLENVFTDGKPVIGENNLFASAVKDIITKELIVKLVNTSAVGQEVVVNLIGSKFESKGSVITLKSSNLQDENTFLTPKKISPTESEYNFKGEKAQMSLPAYSVSVLKLKMK